VAWISTGLLLAPPLASLLEHAEGVPRVWISFESALAFFFVTHTLVALFLPLYFRLGLGRAALLFFGLCPLFLFLVAFFSGHMMIGQAVLAWLHTLRGSVGAGWVLFIVLGITGVFLTLSGGVSCRVFVNRDL
jgi:hypothetical protein